MKYTANISSICPLPSPAHHGYSSSAWRVFHLIHTVSRRIIQQFWWMVRKYQSKLDRRDCNRQLSSKVMWTQRTFKSRQRLAVLIGIETHNTMFFHIHPATVILPYHYTVASFYIFVHQIFACLRTQHLAICRKDLWKMPAEVRHHCLWKDSQVVNTNMQGFRDLVKWQMKRQYDETKFALLHILLNLSRRGRLLDGTEDPSPSEEPSDWSGHGNKSDWSFVITIPNVKSHLSPRPPCHLTDSLRTLPVSLNDRWANTTHLTLRLLYRD